MFKLITGGRLADGAFSYKCAMTQSAVVRQAGAEAIRGIAQGASSDLSGAADCLCSRVAQEALPTKRSRGSGGGPSRSSEATREQGGVPVSRSIRLPVVVAPDAQRARHGATKRHICRPRGAERTGSRFSAQPVVVLGIMAVLRRAPGA